MVVGAGAHVPYGFPTSKSLTEIVQRMYQDPVKVTSIDRLKRSSSEMSNIVRYKYELCDIARSLSVVSPPQVNNSGNDFDIKIGDSLFSFLKSFCEANVYSIDTYLSKITTDKADEEKLVKSDWGRLIVALLISEHERQMPFGTQKHDWIQFLIDRYVRRDFESFFRNPPRIITFNYDRYFERVLYGHLIEHHGVSPNEAKLLIDSLPIIHVYGRLGCFTQWEPSNKRDFFLSAKENIQVIGEHRSAGALKQVGEKIKGILEDSQKIYFIGYGFDDQNNELLTGMMKYDWHQSRRIYSTNIGIKNSYLRRIEQSLGFLPKYIEGPLGTREIFPMNLLEEIEPLEKEPAPNLG